MILQQDHIQMENNVWHQNLDVPGKDIKKKKLLAFTFIICVTFIIKLKVIVCISR